VRNTDETLVTLQRWYFFPTAPTVVYLHSLWCPHRICIPILPPLHDQEGQRIIISLSGPLEGEKGQKTQQVLTLLRYHPYTSKVQTCEKTDAQGVYHLIRQWANPHLRTIIHAHWMVETVNQAEIALNVQERLGLPLPCQQGPLTTPEVHLCQLLCAWKEKLREEKHKWSQWLPCMRDSLAYPSLPLECAVNSHTVSFSPGASVTTERQARSQSPKEPEQGTSNAPVRTPTPPRTRSRGTQPVEVPKGRSKRSHRSHSPPAKVPRTIGTRTNGSRNGSGSSHGGSPGSSHGTAAAR